MTIPSTGAVDLVAVNTEFGLGLSVGVMRGVRYYQSITSTLTNFPTTNLDFNAFRGAASKVSGSITYSSDQQNITINPSSVSGYVAGFTSVTITINSGVYIGSSSTGTYALTITGFVSGDTVNLINNGVIIGAGGAGGSSNNGSNGSPGSSGGNALLLQCAVNVTNNGTIAGGGGGGGAQNGGTTYGGCFGQTRQSYTGQGGGGGAGYAVGSGGSGSPNGNNGTRTTGGSGAGSGGGPGVSGSSSDQAGGSAGYYIVGLSYANFIVIGTRLGLSS